MLAFKQHKRDNVLIYYHLCVIMVEKTPTGITQNSSNVISPFHIITLLLNSSEIVRKRFKSMWKLKKIANGMIGAEKNCCGLHVYILDKMVKQLKRLNN
jgi:hypothetical protein